MSKLRAKDAEDIPIGSIVKTPSGRLAEVLGYRGNQGKRARSGRDHRTRLQCRYLDPEGRARESGAVPLLPELVTVVRYGPLQEAA